MNQWKGIALAFALSLSSSVVSVSLPYMLLYLKGILAPSKTLPAQLVAIDLGALSTAFMLSRTVASSLSHLSRPSIASLTLLISLIGMAFSTSVPQLLIFRILQGSSLGLIWPHIEYSIAKSDRKSSNLALLNLFSNLGFSTGNLMGGFLILPTHPASVRIPFGVSALIALASLPLLVNLNVYKGRGSTSSAMKYLYLSALFSGIALGMRVSVLPTYIIQYVTASPKMYSIAMAIPGYTVLFVSYLIARKTDFLSIEKKLLLSSQLKFIQAISTSLIGFTRDYVALVLLLMLSRLGASTSVSISKAAQGEMGASVKHFGFRQTMFGLGNAIGPLVGSFLYTYLEGIGLGGGWVFAFSALMNVLSSYSLWKSMVHLRNS
ncbi:hypothetical protein EYM_04750 [Ignicoccus islandicus DSM 13165]|uniref:Major facilitator superfamily (MFS) profile domain-containing protein n=1 Tax=Ignicoccus islandicus DSM 13165 TaxID=940295 RepID=A0A0U3EDK3_9CREN|nr:MFS transporter [Ignicoccus islandicus]ALU12515.1 hypothetical protein EYM_04750 [Ignicoccus islandicus DSM 13165]